MGVPENADRGGKCSAAVQLTPASNCTGYGAILGEIKAWEGCSPRVRTLGRLENGGGAMEPRVDGSGTLAAQTAPVSANRTRQRGRGHTEGCPE
jgi:hypothetical protein